MNIDHKIKKYSNKLALNPKHNYLKKLSEYILIKYNMQTGGHVINFNVDDIYSAKVDGLLHLINETIRPLESISTERKYCMIVMGPTGSGKTLARKIGFNLVTNLESKFTKDQIEKSFIDISVDDYVYGATISGKTGKDALKARAEEILLDIQTRTRLTNEENIKDRCNIERLSKDSYNEYLQFRNNVETIPMIMVYIAAHLKLNFIFETVHGEWLPKFILDNIPNYFLIVVYPSTSEINLKERTAKRALQEFRFVDPTRFKSMIKNADKMFNDLIVDNTYKNIYLYKYDNNMGNMEEISRDIFTSIPPLQTKLVINNKEISPI